MSHLTHLMHLYQPQAQSEILPCNCCFSLAKATNSIPSVSSLDKPFSELVSFMCEEFGGGSNEKNPIVGSVPTVPARPYAKGSAGPLCYIRDSNSCFKIYFQRWASVEEMRGDYRSAKILSTRRPRKRLRRSWGSCVEKIPQIICVVRFAFLNWARWSSEKLEWSKSKYNGFWDFSL